MYFGSIAKAVPEAPPEVPEAVTDTGMALLTVKEGIEWV
jgi:mannitol/fructose-specific phosphotransferase system IIA component